MKNIFISYSHKDKNEKKKVEEHLSIFKKYSNTLTTWSDTELKCGDDINPEIIKAINKADAAILIISTNFLNSDFIRIEEIPRLLRRREKAGMPIFPFVVKTCNWHIVLPISRLLARPYDGKALNSFKGDNKERILAEFAKEVNDIVTKEDNLTYNVETKNILNPPKDNNHILEQLYNLFIKFEGLNFIPPNTLSNFQPFHAGKETAFHYENFVLYTLNPDLYWLFDNIKNEGDKIEISEELRQSLTEALSTTDYIEKIEYIIKRLNHSLVFNIEAYKNVNKAQLKLAGGFGGYDLNYPFPYLEDNSARFRIQKEFHSQNCDCIQCLYHDLNFVQAYERLESTLGNTEDYDFKTAYIAYNLGSNNYKDAYLIFKHLKEQYQNNPLKYFIASYNLKYLYYDIKGHYSLNDKEKILDYIREIDLDQIICEIKDRVDSDVHRVIIEIKEEKFISKIRYKVDDIHSQIIKVRDIFSREGSSTGPNYVQQLHVQMALLFGYYEWNYLIGNKYGNVTNIITKIFEALLISQTIEKYDGRLKEFNSFHLLNAILFISPKKLQSTFGNNDIHKISINPDSLVEFINVFNNFLQSNHKKGILGGFVQKEEFFQYLKCFYTKQTIVEIFSNCLFLLSKVGLSSNSLTNSLIINLLNFLKFNSSNLLYGSNNELNLFIGEHKDLFSSNQLEELIELWLTKEYLRNTDLPKTVSEILNERASFNLNDNLADLIISKMANKNSCSDFHHLIYLYKVVSEKKQQLITDFFVNYIDRERIDSMILWELYYYRVISTENNEILKKYINLCISKEVKETHDHPFGNTYKNYTYLNFISLIYLLDINRRHITSLIPKDVTFSPYCEWLLKFDFQEFDYNKFNLQWLLFKKSETFFNQFKKEPRIKKALGDYLLEESNSELGEVFMKYFYKE